jgi:agmatinase
MDKPAMDSAFLGPLKGGAGDPTYAGALSFMRRRYSRDFAAADVVVWGVPFDQAVTNRPGARFGPQAIRRASAIFDGDPQYPSGLDPFAALKVIDAGDALFDVGHPMSVAPAIAAQACAILDAGCHLITLGGDHFITLPLLRAHVRRHGPLALVQFDAHQDTWPDAGDRLSHGTFVTRAVAEGLIEPARSIQIGIRTVAPDDFGLANIDGYAALVLSPEALAARIRERVGGAPAYLTVDIDVLDPAFAPGTGTPVSGGLTSGQLLATLWALRDMDWRGMDVVETSPPYDHAEITAIAASSVAQHYMQILAHRQALTGVLPGASGA